ncbi:hypothetical protein Acy02nite_30270 [Actinoplanes cyaneus]|uniref:Uncharacterized protein n=1 Tax=Actinoplanes cyaneus TaxID=52696 RepID=A0A919IHB5_9ACTN|nr:hypothetical protein [Actinoplanes cyaneus]MCW2137646.1 hypothetical protein [Actinoplanes cyaneus]GID65146.1 hypothetical protein Acy02nite_30270 [Actinoplanes cyaneus]
MTKKTVVALLVTNLAVSVLFALITLLLHDPILAYQHGHDPSADPAALSRTLWTRPLPILGVAMLYARFVRQLLAGDPRALRRVRIVSAAGLIGVGWLLLSGEYPAWLRIVEGVQLLLLAALVITVNLRAVRSAFDAPIPADSRPRNRRAAWTLVLLAPVVAELMLGNIPVRQLWAFPAFIPIYGAGALLIREVTRRTGRGVATMLLLGLAYGLIEEGLVLQSLTSPTIYRAAQWAPRLLCVNSAYTELNLVYHPVFSITIPIVLTELLFARHGRLPYLRRGGLIATGVVAVLGALLVRFAVLPSEDPGYTMPVVAAAAVLAVALLVTVIALRVRREPASRTATATRVLSPAVTAVVTGAGAFAFVALLFPFAGSEQSFFTHGAWAFAPMAAAAGITAGTGLLLRRWTAARSWTRAHLFGAVLGATVGHAVFGLVANAGTLADRLFLGTLTLLTVVLGTMALRRTRPDQAVPNQAVPDQTVTDRAVTDRR